jgi:hypothetical protein
MRSCSDCIKWHIRLPVQIGARRSRCEGVCGLPSIPLTLCSGALCILHTWYGGSDVTCAVCAATVPRRAA